MSTPPPPIVKSVQLTQDPKAGRHVRRVTLNIVRLSAACPDDLRPTLDKLDANDWQIDRLSHVDQEQIYTMIDDELADTAKAEFEADLTSIVDHRHGDTYCKLCGHQHIRFEFELVNNAGGRSTMTGSTCIETYGLNVQGDLTAAEALQALRRTIASAKRQAYREDWQEAHPNHAAAVNGMRLDFDILRFNHQPYGLYRWLKPAWNTRCKSMVAKMRTIFKYYDRETCLTELRTAQLFGGNDMPKPYPSIAVEMVIELGNAREQREIVVDRWDRFITACPKMNRWERRQMDYYRSRGIPPESLAPTQRKILNTIHRHNGSPNLKG